MNSEDSYTLLLVKEHFTHLRHTFEQHNNRLSTLLQQALANQRDEARWLIQAKLEIHVHYLNIRSNFLNRLSPDCLTTGANTWQDFLQIMKCYKDDYPEVIKGVGDETED